MDALRVPRRGYRPEQFPLAGIRTGRTQLGPASLVDEGSSWRKLKMEGGTNQYGQEMGLYDPSLP